MNYKKIAVVLLVLVLCAVAINFVLPKNKTTGIPSGIFTTASTTAEVVVTTERSVDETDSYRIEKSLPVLSGAVSPLVLAKINNTLKRATDSIIKDFKDEVKDIPEMELPENSKDQAKHTLSLSTMKTDTVNSRYFTVRLADYSYISGAAHPLTSTLSYNFDLKTGDLLDLDKVFDGGQNYLGTISSIVKTKLKIQLAKATAPDAGVIPVDEATGLNSDIEGSVGVNPNSDSDGMNDEVFNTVFFEEGADPRDENYSVYFVEKDGIRFVFGQYQVAPYVYGEQEVLLTYDEVKNILNQSFAL
jgi:hypothetical protein